MRVHRHVPGRTSRDALGARFDAQGAALQFALSFGCDIEVIEPAELRSQMIEAARRTVERYSSRVNA